MGNQLFSKKLEIEPKAITLEGVTGVAIGMGPEGKEVIQILLHVPISDFNLPDFLKDPDIELLYVGISAVKRINDKPNKYNKSP